MLTRRERLLKTLRGEPVDRPAVCFYEINGLDQDPSNPDPLNIFTDPSWKPLLDLTRERTEIIPRRGLGSLFRAPSPLKAFTTVERWFDEKGRRFVRTTICAGARTLKSLTRHDPDVDTDWTLEHLLKDEDDLEAWLALPHPADPGPLDPQPVLDAEAKVGDAGLVLIDMADPLCHIAGNFDMATFLVLAHAEPELMHRALQRVSEWLLPRVEAAAAALPGRLWRIVGPEYISPPYLQPSFFKSYVTRYDRPVVEAIQRHGGFARIHSHGRLKYILDDIAATGCAALDPIEPPPQGDVELREVRARHGRQMVLFGNLEASDIENLPTDRFRKKIDQALREGTQGEGRGFVLMPSACPYGRKLPELALRNYEAMVEAVERC